ncbi:hypothetical protein [Tunturiibacter gelidoferens]|uniref:Uncharacterized protein n=3 Tax=Tunturiibacter TaxID=3154218 RepID=A0A7Y9NN18_9BACT|nr:hypothetical protein [Edaphobacter lichenicola]MBB5338999.1 hypothetical protein [Edaphobacter lichenicola]NYF51773.1 hypothetical protein [Edaphobacter lichenicola]
MDGDDISLYIGNPSMIFPPIVGKTLLIEASPEKNDSGMAKKFIR